MSQLLWLLQASREVERICNSLDMSLRLQFVLFILVYHMWWDSADIDNSAALIALTKLLKLLNSQVALFFGQHSTVCHSCCLGIFKGQAFVVVGSVRHVARTLSYIKLICPIMLLSLSGSRSAMLAVLYVMAAPRQCPKLCTIFEPSGSKVSCCDFQRVIPHRAVVVSQAT